MAGNLESPLRIGDLTVYPADGRVVGPDLDARLQPKVIDVLLCLADTPGDVVTRQTLHDRVWGDLVVTDDALNRCISELRRILGDSKSIVTVPKRGYRLAAPVERTEVENESGNVAAPGPPSADGVATVAIMPFECITPDSPNAFLADGLPTALHGSLARLDKIRVVSLQLSFGTQEQDTTASTVGKSLGAQYIISGNVAESGPSMRVIVEVDDAEAGVLLWAQRFDVDTSDVLAFEQVLSDAVIGAFGGVRLCEEIRRAQEAPAETMAAWSLVQRARRYLLQYDAESLAGSLSLLTEAVEREPNYALAHAMQGLLLAEQAVNGLVDEMQPVREAALHAAGHALSLAPTEPAVLRSAGCAQAYCGEYREALRTLRRSVEFARYDFGAWGYLCWPLAATGVVEDLEELHSICDRLLEIAPTHPGAPFWNFHRSVGLMCMGKPEEALRPINTCLDRHPNFVLGLMHRANLLGLLGRTKDAERAVALAAAANSAMTVERYVNIIEQLSDVPEVRKLRTDGLQQAQLKI